MKKLLLSSIIMLGVCGIASAQTGSKSATPQTSTFATADGKTAVTVAPVAVAETDAAATSKPARVAKTDANAAAVPSDAKQREAKMAAAGKATTAPETKVHEKKIVN